MYTWDVVAAMMARQGGKIFHELQADPHIIEVAVRDFSLLAGPTEVTRRRVLTDEPSTTGRAMSGTLRTLLAARAAAVIGRGAERAALLDLAERDRPLVAAVYGIAGIGKSALLAAFAEDARAYGAAVVSLDCGAIEPTERGFLAVLARAIRAMRAEPSGRARPIATVVEAAAALSGLGGRVVLVLDTYEQLRLLDAWLRQDLVPGLRDNTRLVLAGPRAAGHRLDP
jgi:hypothetical protein